MVRHQCYNQRQGQTDSTRINIRVWHTRDERRVYRKVIFTYNGTVNGQPFFLHLPAFTDNDSVFFTGNRFFTFNGLTHLPRVPQWHDASAKNPRLILPVEVDKLLLRSKKVSIRCRSVTVVTPPSQALDT